MVQSNSHKTSHKTIRTVSKKFWRYMKDNDKLPGTRTELRRLYKSSFLPSLSDNLGKRVQFSTVLWYFRSNLKIIEQRPVNDREDIVYLKGKTITVDQSYVFKREGKKSENVDRFDELKKKLVEKR